MDGGVEEAFAATLGVLTMPGVLGDVGEQAGVEYALPIAGRITAAIEVEGGPSEVPPHLLRHLFQRSQALREQDHICFIDGSHGDGS